MKKNRRMEFNYRFPYRKAITREVLGCFILSLLPILLFFEIHSGKIVFLGMNDFGYFVLFSIYVIAIGSVLFFFSLPILFEFLDYKFYDEVEDEILFYNIIEMCIMHNDPVGKILKKRSLRRYVFKGRSQIYTGFLGIKKYRFIRIICTPTCKTYFKLLFFPREGEKESGRKVTKYDFVHVEAFSTHDSGRSRKAYPLRVYYTKYNHSLIRIELIEGIDYPENFTTLIKRANEFV